MSQMSQIRKIILDTLADGNEHTLRELSQIAQDHSIDLPPNSTTLRTCLYNEKRKNPQIITVSRGTYKLLAKEPETVQSPPDAFEKAVGILENELQELNSFNWITCSDEELANARNHVSSLENLNKKILSFLKKNSSL